MDLKIKDVAELLNVSETTIRRWLSEGKIPAYKLHHQYRFSRTEIEDWMLSHRLSSQPQSEEKVIYPLDAKEDEVSEAKKGWQPFSLFRAIHKGDLLHMDHNGDKEQLIRDVMNQVAPILQVDADGMSDMLLDREGLMPTSFGHGVAVPHTRDFLLKGGVDVVCPVFLKNPINWGALDGKPVHTLFFLFASDDKHHLNLLAKLAHLTSDEKMRALFEGGPNKAELLDTIKKWESSDPHVAPSV